MRASDWRFEPLATTFGAYTVRPADTVTRFFGPDFHEQRGRLHKNEDVWKLFLTDQEELEREIDALREDIKGLAIEGHIPVHELEPLRTAGWGPYNRRSTKLDYDYSETRRVACNLRLLQEIVLVLQGAGWVPAEAETPLEHLAARRVQDPYPLTPLSACIPVADARKHEAGLLLMAATDKRGTARGTMRLVYALLALWPWTATPLLFDPDEAFRDAFAVLELAIWDALFKALASLHDPALTAAPAEMRTEGPDAAWAPLALARLCALVPVYSPYADAFHLNRGYYGVMATAKFFPFLKADVWTAWRGLRMEPVLHSYSLAGWAHAPCTDDHYCAADKFPDGEMEKLRVWREKRLAEAEKAWEAQKRAAKRARLDAETKKATDAAALPLAEAVKRAETAAPAGSGAQDAAAPVAAGDADMDAPAPADIRAERKAKKKAQKLVKAAAKLIAEVTAPTEAETGDVAETKSQRRARKKAARQAALAAVEAPAKLEVEPEGEAAAAKSAEASPSKPAKAAAAADESMAAVSMELEAAPAVSKKRKRVAKPAEEIPMLAYASQMATLESVPRHAVWMGLDYPAVLGTQWEFFTYPEEMES